MRSDRDRRVMTNQTWLTLGKPGGNTSHYPTNPMVRIPLADRPTRPIGKVPQPQANSFFGWFDLNEALHTSKITKHISRSHHCASFTDTTTNWMLLD